MILSVAGARPNFMKVGPVHEALARQKRFEHGLVHTGQHYDDEMSDVFFRQLGLPEPIEYLGVGSDSHARQTAGIMAAFEAVVESRRPEAVIVVGDVNSTLACALVAAKLHIRVAHVEAGLRSFNDRMPEEINRRLTDHLCDWLFVTEQSGVDNLRREGVAADRIHLVGNVMIDSLVRCVDLARQQPVREELDLVNSPYVLMTMHRPSNVDPPGQLSRVAEMIESIGQRWRLVFPMHPRTRSRLEDEGMLASLESIDSVTLLEPLGYVDFLNLLEHAGVVVTDSGGIQEETTFLRVPCITVREETERPVTVEMGTNELSPLNPSRVAQRVSELMEGRRREGDIPPLWDGKAAERIVTILARDL